MKNHNLPPHMEQERVKIEQYAREMGLDFPQVIFQLLDHEELYAVAAYGGFPNRYPHWRFGMEYEKMHKGYSYGLSKIYEMVINNDPSYAYLLDCNNMTEQKAVMAHVYGHVDFFKNNYRFAPTNKKMMDGMANHATRIRKYVDRFGINQVEEFIDTCLSLESLIDLDAVHLAATKRRRRGSRKKRSVKLKVDRQYMDSYVNPPEGSGGEKSELVGPRLKRRFFAEPEKDVLGFLLKKAPLKPWQRSVLSIIREEMYYFGPQGETKILNEGWATFCHSRIMTARALDSSEIVDYADFHSGGSSQYPGRLNPYALGLSLLLDIEDRWNKGRYGKEYEECDNLAKKLAWDTGEMTGLEKVFEVRKRCSDLSFLDEFLTPEFCAQQKLFSFSKYDLNGGGAMWLVDSKEFLKVKEKLLFSLTNFGQPFIYVTGANYDNRGELLLHHRWEGVPLDMEYAERTLVNLEKLWERPVNLETFVIREKNTNNGEWTMMNCDLGDVTSFELEERDLSYKY
ncbi:SpoVR family protein [Candidatus Woesearchaeota archaeon]|nr:SpoVR family protein [Candidatus Woesearchaeota archaeon]